MLLLIIGDDIGNVATAPATTTVKLKAFSLFHWGNKQVSRQAASQPGVDYLLEKLKKYLYIYKRTESATLDMYTYAGCYYYSYCFCIVTFVVGFAIHPEKI